MVGVMGANLAPTLLVPVMLTFVLELHSVFCFLFSPTRSSCVTSINTQCLIDFAVARTLF